MIINKVYVLFLPSQVRHFSDDTFLYLYFLYLLHFTEAIIYSAAVCYNITNSVPVTNFSNQLMDNSSIWVKIQHLPDKSSYC